MSLYPGAFGRLQIAMLLSVLAAVPAVGVAAPVQKTARATAPKSAGNTGIIPLPLTPIVPAAQRSCAARAPSGLGYTVLRAGSGPKPAADATVLVNYIGYLNATGAVFDQNMQTPMPVGGVIPGFSEGLQMLSRGEVLRLCIPAALGYGATATGPIPANADLVFQVELLDFKTAAEIDAMRAAAPGGAAQP